MDARFVRNELRANIFFSVSEIFNSDGQDPLYLPARSELEVYLYRLTDPNRRRVWFEWSAEVFLPLSSFKQAKR